MRGERRDLRCPLGGDRTTFDENAGNSLNIRKPRSNHFSLKAEQTSSVYSHLLRLYFGNAAQHQGCKTWGSEFLVSVALRVCDHGGSAETVRDICQVRIGEQQAIQILHSTSIAEPLSSVTRQARSTCFIALSGLCVGITCVGITCVACSVVFLPLSPLLLTEEGSCPCFRVLFLWSFSCAIVLRHNLIDAHCLSGLLPRSISYEENNEHEQHLHTSSPQQ